MLQEIKKDKHCISYMGNVKRLIQMDVLAKQEQTHRGNKLMVTKGQRKGQSDKVGVCD